MLRLTYLSAFTVFKRSIRMARMILAQERKDTIALLSIENCQVRRFAEESSMYRPILSAVENAQAKQTGY